MGFQVAGSMLQALDHVSRIMRRLLRDGTTAGLLYSSAVKSPTLHPLTLLLESGTPLQYHGTVLVLLV